MVKAGEKFDPAPLGPGTGKGGKKTKRKKRKRPRRDPGKKLMEQAKLWESGGNYGKALDLYKEIEEMGAKSKHSREAARRYEELLSDKEIAAAYKEHLAEKHLDHLLAMAESYYLGKDYKSMREWCDKLLQEAPDSKQAKEAKKLLRKVEKAGK
jgi:hypothetical protein